MHLKKINCPKIDYHLIIGMVTTHGLSGPSNSGSLAI